MLPGDAEADVGSGAGARGAVEEDTVCVWAVFVGIDLGPSILELEAVEFAFTPAALVLMPVPVPLPFVVLETGSAVEVWGLMGSIDFLGRPRPRVGVD